METATFTKINPSFGRVLGYSDNDVLGHSYLDFIHPDDVDSTINVATEEMTSGKQVTRFENRYRKKSGDYIWLNWASSPNSDTGFTYAIARDVTEQKREKEFNEKSREILEMIATGESASSIYDAIALMYEARHSGLRCSLLELEGNVLRHGGAPSFPEEYCKAVDGLVNGPSVGSCGTSTYTGKRVLVEDIATDPKWEKIKHVALPHGMRCCWSEPIKNSSGKVLGAFGMYYNHTALPNEDESSDLGSAARLAGIIMEREQAAIDHMELEKQLLQSQKMEAIGTLVGGIAHDFNNTLAAVQGNLYLAKNTMDDKAILGSKLDNIEKLSNRAARMVQQLLTFARKDMVSTRPFSLTSFINEEYKLARSLIPENIDFNIDLCDEELIIHGDATQLQQALLNLLNNARDAVRNSSKPKITCRLESFSMNAEFHQKHPDINGNRVTHLMIEDNGCGISEDALPQIFVPFFTTKGVGEGTGLGLAMVYGSIQTHGGAIEVDSRENKGTTFHIYLPLAKDLEQMIEEPKQAVALGEGETILLVDDETDMRETVGEVLSQLGYTVLLASDGEEAVELFKANPDAIDVIISDVVMPKMGGAELVKHVHEVKRELPIILVTGYDKNWAINIEDNLGHIKTLNKPFSYERLSQILRTLFESK